ncbi:Biopterin transport-related protein BT1 [Corchorus capsularis]|uniref:Biopterin transport-related protein BT1 n=1 Tax=Corchorus capsularis TaxID=210143 RepID=A0A1R3GTW6_COCAP|nr:Biopterin transport-related protein BT1 [Corchorus capsularis]
MVEEGKIVEGYEKGVEENDDEGPKGICYCFWGPIHWLKMLADEMHWSFVFGYVSIYGINQGVGGALARIGTQYYMKDVQKVQPSESQVYSGITSIPWVIKPLWGLLTDVIPIFGYRRKPYFILSGILGVISMLIIALSGKMHLVFLILALLAQNVAVTVADVTVDACVAQNSITYPSRAADMQSLGALSYSIGGLLGFSVSGVFVHLMGPKGVFGLLTLPAALVSLVGILLLEPKVSNFAYSEVSQKFLDATKAMWTTLKCPDVWRPCLYMYLSFAVSLNINEGLFYWYTDAKDGPSFSQETVGYIFSMGAIGALLGAILYQNVLKEHHLRDMLFWTQLLFGLAGMLDLMLVQRMNLRFGIPDYFFVVIGEAVSQLITRLKWMPLLVLSSKLCPSGIEGTFFALLMSIDNFGGLSSSWGGGLMLHVLGITRTKFHNLWLAILIRNILRVSPLCLLFLVPGGDPNTFVLPTELLNETETQQEPDNIELVSLVNSVDDGR